MGEAPNKELCASGVAVDWLQQSSSSGNFPVNEKSVKVVTFHSSKGLEFPVVALPGLGYLRYVRDGEQGEIPFGVCGKDKGIEPDKNDLSSRFSVRISVAEDDRQGSRVEIARLSCVDYFLICFREVNNRV